MLGLVRLHVVLLAGPGAKKEVGGLWLWLLVRVHWLLPVVAVDVQPLTGPSNDSFHKAATTVKAAGRVNDSSPGLITVTSHDPEAAPARLNSQRSMVVPVTVMPVPWMSGWPARCNLMLVALSKAVPVTSIAIVPGSALLGVTSKISSGGGGGGSLPEPEINSEKCCWLLARVPSNVMMHR